VQAALTIITAVSLLLHTLLGCCSHGAAGSCACGHEAKGHVERGDRHDHDDSHAGECAHAHDAEHADDERTHDAEEPRSGDHSPAHPCHCHCDGNRCQAIAAATPPTIELSGSVLVILPPLVATSVDCGDGVRGRGGADAAGALPTLPVRAHLLYQTLLI
jgi:hypothetical protein